MKPALAIAALLAGCASTQVFVDNSRKALAVASEVQVDAIGAFVKYDQVHQEAIVAKDEPVAARKAELAAYRVTQSKAMDAFDALGSVTQAAAKTLDAIEAGTMKDTDFVPYLAAVLSAAMAVHDVLAALGIDLPALDTFVGKPPPPPPLPSAPASSAARVSPARCAGKNYCVAAEVR